MKSSLLLKVTQPITAVLVFLISSVGFSQTVTNGSFTNATGNSVTPAGWINANGQNPGVGIGGFPTVDVLDITFSSYSGASTVPAIFSPNGGTWTGLSDIPGSENEAIEQTVTGFVVGQSYTITYYAANFGSQSFDDEGTINAYLDGALIATSANLPVASVWIPVSANFVATSVNSILQIDVTRSNIAVGPGSYLSADGVAITTNVPVPCNVGSLAPILSQTNACVSGPFNLTSITSTTVPVGTVLAWFSGTPASVANLIASPTNVSTGTFYGAFYDAVNNCFSPTSPVVLNPNPVANFTIVDACLGSAHTFTNQSTIPSGSITQNSWSFGDGGTSLVQNPSYIYAAQNASTVTLTVTSNLGCTDTQTATANVITSPTASFVFNPTESTVLNPTVNFVNTSSNGLNSTWYFGDGGSSTQLNPSYTYPAEYASYTVSLIVGSGACSDTASAIILIDDLLLYYVPNTFTPDGDEFNQIFQPVFTSGFDPYDFNLKLFNRWGEIIYESNNAEFGWDGTYHGKIAQEGVYVWKIEFKTRKNDERIQLHGNVLLIR